MGQGTRPPILGPGRHYHKCPPLFDKTNRLCGFHGILLHQNALFYFNVDKEDSLSFWGTSPPDSITRVLPWIPPDPLLCLHQPWCQVVVYYHIAASGWIITGNTIIHDT